MEDLILAEFEKELAKIKDIAQGNDDVNVVAVKPWIRRHEGNFTVL